MRYIRTNEISAEMDGKEVKIGGWLQESRNLGGISFGIIRDRYGTVQVTVRKKESPDLAKIIGEANRESVLIVTGRVSKSDKTPRGFEIIPNSIVIDSSAQSPLPLGVVDRVSAELDTRLNNRFIDLRKENVERIFEVKSEMLFATRSYLRSIGFIEVQTPKIAAVGAEGGATLFKLDYFGKTAYLAQSPQLYKQNLMGAGFDKVFEIAPAFRAEASDTVRHLAEFTSLDVEMSFIESSEDVMDVAQGITFESMKHLAEKCKPLLEKCGIEIELPKLPFRRISYSEAIELANSEGAKIRSGEDLGTEGEKALGTAVKSNWNEELYFITDFPTELKKATFYAMRKDDNPELTTYFDLDFRGQEIVSGGQREHRLDKLLAQMKENNLDPERFGFYIEAFKYGMPPHGGFGYGVERFVQKLLDLTNIREAILYPRDRLRLMP
ncbi:MAG: aspartate--tRNA(Asn) ligase [Thermoplasmata archaeon]|nr:aspartate--tRNA(Asn) ligase [Thermoplasmata archaeon]